MLTQRMAQHEKAAWMLRSIMQESAVLQRQDGQPSQQTQRQ
jgi:hypothetical protein